MERYLEPLRAETFISQADVSHSHTTPCRCITQYNIVDVAQLKVDRCRRGGTMCKQNHSYCPSARGSGRKHYRNTRVSDKVPSRLRGKAVSHTRSRELEFSLAVDMTEFKLRPLLPQEAMMLEMKPSQVPPGDSILKVSTHAWVLYIDSIWWRML